MLFILLIHYEIIYITRWQQAEFQTDLGKIILIVSYCLNFVQTILIMDEACGIIERIRPSVISWKLKYRKCEKTWSSEIFLMKDCCFYFRILYVNGKTESRDFQLCEKFQGILKSYDLHLVLRYTYGTNEIELKNIKGSYRGTYFVNYFLAKISINHLLEINCTFLNMKIIDDNTQKSEYKEDISNERVILENKDDEEEISENIKNEEEKNRKEKESIKTRGEIALIGNLKTVFLSEESSDIILKVGDQKYHAHRVIIGAWSNVFEAMFRNNMKEKNTGEVEIPDCDPLMFRDFLLYLYSGSLDNVTNDNVFELYHMSDKYDVKELRLDCVDFIMNNLTVDTICDALFLATRHCEGTLLNRAVQFFTDNAKEIIITVSWQKFLKENPVEANELFIKTLTKDNTKQNLLPM